MNFETLLVEKKEKVTVVTINRPQALNALNAQVISELESFLTQYKNNVQNDNDSRVLILTGSGEKAFVAGADIKELSTLNAESALSLSVKGQKVFSLLESLPQVVIGAVNGFALGGGLELALCCDFLIASSNAKLGLPEVTLGLIPGYGGTQRLSRLLGPARAKQMIYSGQHLNATEALQLGLINQVVEANLIETCLTLAQKIALNSPMGIAMAKKCINEGYDLKLSEGLSIEAAGFAKLFGSKDQKEGVTAFMEKRKPQF